METTTDRTTAREARFVEEGHHAVLDRDEIGPHIRVVSETLGQRGIAYKVRVATAGPGRPLILDCAADGPVGADGHPPLSSVNGVPPCKHAAGAARRLGREGYATPVLPGVYGAVVTRDTRWLAAEAISLDGPVLISVPAGRIFAEGLADETLDRRGAARAAAMKIAAAGPDGNPFGGF